MKTGIIGCGSLGTAILKSIYKLNSNSQCIVSRKSYPKLLDIESEYRCNITQSNCKVAQRSSDLFLCIKPNTAKEVCQEIRGHLNKNTVVISIMAAVPFAKLQEWLDHENVVKTMPTISLPKGPVVVYNPLNLKFKKFSDNYVVVNDENLVDMSTAVSGCMTGFLANVMEQWIAAAMNLGMDRKLAERLICSNVGAFGDLNAVSKEDLQNIQSAVASKGGATEEGLFHLRYSNIEAILGTTMKLADDRVLTLAKKLRE